MAIDRLTRLNAQLQRELGTLCERHIRPFLPATLVTVTGVELASNLRNANVFVSVYGPGKHVGPKALEVLNRRKSILQAELGKVVIMKYTPVLNFKLDETAERADRVMTILKELNLPDEEPKSPEMTEKSEI